MKRTPANPRARRAPCLNALEARRLLAFTAAQYFPLPPGETWQYAGTFDNEQAMEVRTTAADLFNGKPVIRVDDVLTTPSDVQHASDYFTTGSDGLHLLRNVSSSGGEGVTLDFDRPLLFLPPSFFVTDDFTVPKTGASITIVDDEVGTLTGRGNVSGAISIDDHHLMKLPDGRTADAMKVAIDLHYDFAGKDADGKPFSFHAEEGESLWLAPGIGPMSDGDELTGTITRDGDGPRAAKVVLSMALTNASLMGSIPRATVKAGVASVPGTPSNDVIVVENFDSKTVSVTLNGLTETLTATRVNVFAGDGSDLVQINTFAEGAYVDAGPGNDSIRGSENSDTLTGGAGKDTLFGGEGDDRLNGSGGHDVLTGYYGNDRLYGGNENDALDGGNGVDRLWGGIGDDQLSGAGSNDKLFGEDGNDVLFGGNQDDHLDGGAGNDVLRGGAGNDFLTAAGGNDILIGEAGNDSLLGDAGNDLMSLLDREIDHADGGSGTNTASGDPDDILLNV